MKDLKNPTVLSKAESGFLKVIVYPLYQTLDKFYLTEGLVHKFKKNIEENIKEYFLSNVDGTRFTRPSLRSKKSRADGENS